MGSPKLVFGGGDVGGRPSGGGAGSRAAGTQFGRIWRSCCWRPGRRRRAKRPAAGRRFQKTAWVNGYSVALVKATVFVAVAVLGSTFAGGTLRALLFVASLQRSSELRSSQLRSGLRLRAATHADRRGLMDHRAVLGNKFGGHLQSTLDRAQIRVCCQRTDFPCGNVSSKELTGASGTWANVDEVIPALLMNVSYRPDQS